MVDSLESAKGAMERRELPSLGGDITLADLVGCFLAEGVAHGGVLDDASFGDNNRVRCQFDLLVCPDAG